MTKAALLLVVGEPFDEDQRSLILERVLDELNGWDHLSSGCNLQKELDNLVAARAVFSPEAGIVSMVTHEAESLSTTILIDPDCKQLHESLQNFLLIDCNYRHLIFAGFTIVGSGSWILRDDVFTFQDFVKVLDGVTRGKSFSLTVGLACEWDWSRNNLSKLSSHGVKLPKENIKKRQDFKRFHNYMNHLVSVTDIKDLLKTSNTIGTISFSAPTLYIFPGGSGSCALFGVKGFTALVDGGYGRKPCFWDFARHVQQIDVMLLSHLGIKNILGIHSFLERKLDTGLPDVGSVYFNCPEKFKKSPSPSGLKVNIFKNGAALVETLNALGLPPQACFSLEPTQPVTLFNKLGFGSVDMYVLNPTQNAEEMSNFYNQWSLLADSECLASHSGIPVSNLLSISVLLVWKPFEPNKKIVRILLPGGSPQSKIFEGLDRLKNMALFDKANLVQDQSNVTSKEPTEKSGKSQNIGGKPGRPAPQGPSGNSKPASSRGNGDPEVTKAKLTSDNRDSMPAKAKVEAREPAEANDKVTKGPPANAKPSKTSEDAEAAKPKLTSDKKDSGATKTKAGAKELAPPKTTSASKSAKADVKSTEKTVTNKPGASGGSKPAGKTPQPTKDSKSKPAESLAVPKKQASKSNDAEPTAKGKASKQAATGKQVEPSKQPEALKSSKSTPTAKPKEEKKEEKATAAKPQTTKQTKSAEAVKPRGVARQTSAGKESDKKSSRPVDTNKKESNNESEAKATEKQVETPDEVSVLPPMVEAEKEISDKNASNRAEIACSDVPQLQFLNVDTEAAVVQGGACEVPRGGTECDLPSPEDVAQMSQEEEDSYIEELPAETESYDAIPAAANKYQGTIEAGVSKFEDDANVVQHRAIEEIEVDCFKNQAVRSETSCQEEIRKEQGRDLPMENKILLSDSTMSNYKEVYSDQNATVPGEKSDRNFKHTQILEKDFGNDEIIQSTDTAGVITQDQEILHSDEKLIPHGPFENNEVSRKTDDQNCDIIQENFPIDQPVASDEPVRIAGDPPDMAVPENILEIMDAGEAVIIADDQKEVIGFDCLHNVDPMKVDVTVRIASDQEHVVAQSVVSVEAVIIADDQKDRVAPEILQYFESMISEEITKVTDEQLDIPVAVIENFHDFGPVKIEEASRITFDKNDVDAKENFRDPEPTVSAETPKIADDQKELVVCENLNDAEVMKSESTTRLADDQQDWCHRENKQNTDDEIRRNEEMFDLDCEYFTDEDYYRNLQGHEGTMAQYDQQEIQRIECKKNFSEDFDTNLRDHENDDQNVENQGHSSRHETLHYSELNEEFEVEKSNVFHTETTSELHDDKSNTLKYEGNLELHDGMPDVWQNDGSLEILDDRSDTLQLESISELQDDKSDILECESIPELHNEKLDVLQLDSSSELLDEQPDILVCDSSLESQDEKADISQRVSTPELQNEQPNILESESTSELQVEKSGVLQHASTSGLIYKKFCEYQCESDSELQEENLDILHSENISKIQNDKSDIVQCRITAELLDVSNVLEHESNMGLKNEKSDMQLESLLEIHDDKSDDLARGTMPELHDEKLDILQHESVLEIHDEKSNDLICETEPELHDEKLDILQHESVSEIHGDKSDDMVRETTQELHDEKLDILRRESVLETHDEKSDDLIRETMPELHDEKLDILQQESLYEIHNEKSDDLVCETTPELHDEKLDVLQNESVSEIHDEKLDALVQETAPELHDEKLDITQHESVSEIHDEKSDNLVQETVPELHDEKLDIKQHESVSEIHVDKSDDLVCETTPELYEEKLDIMQRENILEIHDEKSDDLIRETMRELHDEKLDILQHESASKIYDEKSDDVERETMPELHNEKLDILQHESSLEIHDETSDDLVRETTSELHDENLDKMQHETVSEIHDEKSYDLVRETMPKLLDEKLDMTQHESILEIDEEKSDDLVCETTSELHNEKLDILQHESSLEIHDEKLDDLVCETTPELHDEKLDKHESVLEIHEDKFEDLVCETMPELHGEKLDVTQHESISEIHDEKSDDLVCETTPELHDEKLDILQHESVSEIHEDKFEDLVCETKPKLRGEKLDITPHESILEIHDEKLDDLVCETEPELHDEKLDILQHESILEIHVDKSDDLVCETTSELPGEKMYDLQGESISEFYDEKLDILQNEGTTELPTEQASILQYVSTSEMQDEESNILECENASELHDENLQQGNTLELEIEKSEALQCESMSEVLDEKLHPLQRENSLKIQDDESDILQCESTSRLLDQNLGQESVLELPVEKSGVLQQERSSESEVGISDKLQIESTSEMQNEEAGLLDHESTLESHDGNLDITLCERSLELNIEKSDNLEGEHNLGLQDGKMDLLRQETTSELEVEESNVLVCESTDDVHDEKSNSFECNTVLELHEDNLHLLQHEDTSVVQHEISDGLPSESISELLNEKADILQSESTAELQGEKTDIMQSGSTSEFDDEKWEILQREITIDKDLEISQCDVTLEVCDDVADHEDKDVKTPKIYGLVIIEQGSSSDEYYIPQVLERVTEEEDYERDDLDVVPEEEEEEEAEEAGKEVEEKEEIGNAPIMIEKDVGGGNSLDLCTDNDDKLSVIREEEAYDSIDIESNTVSPSDETQLRLNATTNNIVSDLDDSIISWQTNISKIEEAYDMHTFDPECMEHNDRPMPYPTAQQEQDIRTGVVQEQQEIVKAPDEVGIVEELENFDNDAVNLDIHDRPQPNDHDGDLFKSNACEANSEIAEASKFFKEQEIVNVYAEAADEAEIIPESETFSKNFGCLTSEGVFEDEAKTLPIVVEEVQNLLNSIVEGAAFDDTIAGSFITGSINLGFDDGGGLSVESKQLTDASAAFEPIAAAEEKSAKEKEEKSVEEKEEKSVGLEEKEEKFVEEKSAEEISAEEKSVEEKEEKFVEEKSAEEISAEEKEKSVEEKSAEEKEKSVEEKSVEEKSVEEREEKIVEEKFAEEISAEEKSAEEKEEKFAEESGELVPEAGQFENFGREIADDNKMDGGGFEDENSTNMLDLEPEQAPELQTVSAVQFTSSLLAESELETSCENIFTEGENRMVPLNDQDLNESELMGDDQATTMTDPDKEDEKKPNYENFNADSSNELARNETSTETEMAVTTCDDNSDKEPIECKPASGFTAGEPVPEVRFTQDLVEDEMEDSNLNSLSEATFDDSELKDDQTGKLTVSGKHDESESIHENSDTDELNEFVRNEMSTEAAIALFPSDDANKEPIKCTPTIHFADEEDESEVAPRVELWQSPRRMSSFWTYDNAPSLEMTTDTDASNNVEEETNNTERDINENIDVTTVPDDVNSTDGALDWQNISAEVQSNSVEQENVVGLDSDVENDPVKTWGQPMGLPAPNPTAKLGKAKTKPPADAAKTTPVGTSDKSSAAAQKKAKDAKAPVAPKLTVTSSQSQAKEGTSQMKESKTAANKKQTNASSEEKKPAAAAASTGTTLESTTTAPAKKNIVPFYVDLTYIPGDGDPSFVNADFFRRVRARRYVLSALDPDPKVLSCLVEGKRGWEDKDLPSDVIPTYDSEALQRWRQENGKLLEELKITILPAASKCTIKLQTDEDEGCCAFRVEF